MNVVVKAEEFRDYLQENNLVIVHKSMLEDEKSLEFLRNQKALMKRDALTPGEIVKAKLVKVGSANLGRGVVISPASKVRSYALHNKQIFHHKNQ